MTQQEQIDEDLVLVGATNYDYAESLRTFIQNKQFVWSAWSFKIREEWRQTISERLKQKGKFPMFFYLSKKRGGNGLVSYIAAFSEIRMNDTPIPSPDKNFTNIGEEEFPTDNFKSYTWFKFVSVDPIGPYDIKSFSDIRTEETVNPSQLINSFAYAFIVPAEAQQSTGEEEAVATPAGLSVVERTLRKYLMNNLESLEPGLKIFQDGERIGEEYSIEAGRMRIDILAKDVTGSYVVIELKAEVADQSTFGQISAYMGWVKKNLARDGVIRGIIVANDFDDRIKYAAQSVTNIKLKRYKIDFQFSDENL